MQRRTIKQCGICSLFAGFMRRAMCITSRRGSGESYYRELGDQDTLRIEDKSSDLSQDSDEHCADHQHITRNLDDVRLRLNLVAELSNMTKKNLCTGRFLTMHKRRRKRLLTRSLYQEPALLDDLHPGQVQRILDQSMQWKFNAFTLETVTGGRCLPVLCVHLFQCYGLISYYNLDVAKAWKLFSLIEEGYHSTNPFHNSVHAADVTQAMHCFLQQSMIRDHIEPLEIMASLLAAIAHDMDHPGVNQPFLMATSNHLASLYRNTSVLENHHWRSAISCIIESGLLDQMQDLRVRLEKQISSLILATDITRQQEYLSQFKMHLDTNTLDMKVAEHRHLVLQIALKCADISNPCRPWDISRKWSLKVCEEFFRQGDYERKLNLPITALCDRHTTSIPKIQTGFYKFIVTPLITEWHKFLNNDLSTQMLENLLYNQSKWEMLLAKETEEETKTEISDADMVDDDLETGSGTNISDSSEMLLPPLRRGSLNAVKQDGLKEQLRRLSMPLNMFQDSKFKSREKKSATSLLDGNDNANALSSEQSIDTQLGHCDPAQNETIPNTEKLLPDTSIASITTPVQATRLNTILKNGSTWKLVRQQTFPPLEPVTREPYLSSRPIYSSNEGAIFSTTHDNNRFSDFFPNDDKSDDEEASENNNVDVTDARRVEKVKEPARVAGRQLRENLTSIQLEPFEPDQQHLHRRKSVPPDTVSQTPRDKKVRDGSAIPDVLRHSLASKDCWPHRRGSAPVSVAPSELRNLTALSALRHSVNGRSRKPSPVPTCQQQHAKPTVQDRNIPSLPRRSSLPVEIYHPTSEVMKTSESK